MADIVNELGATAAVADIHARLAVVRDEFTLDAETRIPAGRTTALLGPNGAGKSTVVAALAGLLPLDGGRITHGERVLDAPEEDLFVPTEDRRVGVVFQHHVLFDHLSVFDNVAFGPRSRGRSRSGATSTARRWLDRLDLAELSHRRPRDLSGGQAQRVALCRALASDPAVLLLDEPLSALDVSTRVELRRILADHLAAFAGPRLLITHDPVEAFLLADVIHVIEDGRITQTGTPDDIRLRPRTPYIADLAGSNLLRGSASAGIVDIDGHALHVADTTVEGDVLVTVHPRAVTLHRQHPEGSPRNTWRTTIDRVEHLGDRVRVQVGEPLPLAVEITPAAVTALGLRAGARVWVAVKATNVTVTADHPESGVSRARQDSNLRP